MTESIIRSGYAGPSIGYPDLRFDRDHQQGLLPCKVAPTLREEIQSGRHLVAKIFQWGQETINERSYKYAIDTAGNIHVGRLMLDHPDFPQYEHHSQLVNGANVFGAGWLYFNESGQITSINATSYHYWPIGVKNWGEQFFECLKDLLKQIGIETTSIIFEA